MGLGLIATGFAFFIIPGYGLIDIMPDFIGALLIVAGLSKLRDADGRLESARSVFLRFMFIDLIKNLLIIPIYSTDETTVMTVCFIFSIICAVLLFSGFSNLFEGIYYLGTRVCSRAAEENSVGVKTISCVFSVVYYVLLMIPQLVVLTNSEYQMTDSLNSGLTLYNYRNIVTVLCFVIAFLVGTVFASGCIKYILRIRKEKESVEGIKKIYSENIRDRSGLILCRKYSSAFNFIFAGLLFMSSFRFDGVNIIPCTVGFALIATGFFRLRKDVPSTKNMFVVSTVFAVLSAPCYALCFYVADNYFRAATVTDKIRRLYVLKSVCEAAEFAMLAATVFMIYKLLVFIIKNRIGTDSADTESFNYRRDEYMKKSFLKRAVMLLVFGIGFCVFGGIISFFTTETEVLWLLPAVTAVAYAVFSGKTFSALYDSVETKYL